MVCVFMSAVRKAFRTGIDSICTANVQIHAGYFCNPAGLYSESVRARVFSGLLERATPVVDQMPAGTLMTGFDTLHLNGA